MYFVTVKLASGEYHYIYRTDAAALARMRQWSKHPSFISAEAMPAIIRKFRSVKNYG